MKWNQFVVLTTCCLMSVQTLSAFQVQQSPVLGKPELNEPKNLNVESFNFIWKTIKDTHWDADLVGESWDKHKEELLPKVEAAEDIHEARAVMSELIGRLEQSHFGVIPSDSYDVMDGEAGGSSDIGIKGRLIDGELVVTQVRKGSTAESAGVKPGWAIEQIGKRSSEELIERFKKAEEGPQRAETIAGLGLRRLTSGSAGQEISIRFSTTDGQEKDLKIGCATPPGKMARLGNLPPMLVSDETRTLEDNIGYYQFSAFLDPIRIMPNYRKAVRNAEHTGGLVIDLRGNVGGLAAMTMGMAGEFVTERKSLGTMDMKGNSLKFVANPRANPIKVPVAVLVDECSISSAEIFAGGLQDLGLAKVFGKRTAGLALPSMVVKLPNGDGFQYAMADYHSANGESLEVNGVTPDENVKLTKENLSQENDPVLNAAIEWIKKQNQQQEK